MQREQVINSLNMFYTFASHMKEFIESQGHEVAHTPFNDFSSALSELQQENNIPGDYFYKQFKKHVVNGVINN